jgi:prepilin-type N-terminal cleavage/methylation domain-containing protein
MRGPSSGFTLIEIAVAVSILGVGVVTLQQVYQGSLRLQNRAARQSMAVFRARMAMDQLVAERSVKEGEACKTSDTYKVCWKAAKAGPEDGGGPADDGAGLEELELSLYALEVDVTWQDGAGDKTYVLRTLRTAPPPED